MDISVIGETWNEHSSVEQVHREARELAIKRVTELCQRYVRLVGVPHVEAVITEKK